MWMMLCFLAPPVSLAVDISVGGVSLAIPDPDGFRPVTQQMPALYELQRQLVAPTNEEFAAFIPEADVPAALANDIPDLPRRFAVQTAKPLVSAPIAAADFIRLKSALRSQNAELLAQVEERLPGLIRDLNEGLTEKYGPDVALSVPQFVPFPVHEETDRTMAYSALVKYDVTDQTGAATTFTSVVTTTVIHIRGKVLFLYSYADQADLEWSRAASRRWANTVVAANPPDAAASVREALPSAVSRLDWSQVGTKAAAGAIGGMVIGLVIALIGRVRRRGKP
jgi:hypothetical protein